MNRKKVFASKEQHKQWIENNYNSMTWKEKGYLRYKEVGAVSNPNIYFDEKWNYFTGKPNEIEKEYASEEQHIEWIAGKYTSYTWKKEGYPKYRDQGALLNPNLHFDKSWNFFTKKEEQKRTIHHLLRA